MIVLHVQQENSLFSKPSRISQFPKLFENKMAQRLLYYGHMNMTTQHTSPAGSLTAGSYSGKKESTAAKTDFDALIDMAASAPEAKSAQHSSAPDSPDIKNKEVVTKTSNDTANDAAETANTQPAQQSSQNNDTTAAAPAESQTAQQSPLKDDNAVSDPSEPNTDATQSLPDVVAVMLQVLGQQTSQSSTEVAPSFGEEHSDTVQQVQNSTQPAAAQQNPENNKTLVPGSQNVGALQDDTKNAPSATEVATAWPEEKVQGVAQQKSSPESAPKQTSDKKEDALTASAPEQQIPDNNTMPVSKKPALAEKNMNVTAASVSGESSLSSESKGSQDAAQIPANTAEPQTKSDISHLANQETAALQQSSQNTKSTSGEAVQFENTLSAVRTQTNFDLTENKATIISTGNRLAVSLEPEGLGKLNINLSLDRGMVNAQIQAADPAAKNLLENNMQQIMDTLMREGLNVGGFSVSLKHGETGDMNGQGTNDFGKSSQEESTNIPSRYQNDPVGRISMFV